MDMCTEWMDFIMDFMAIYGRNKNNDALIMDLNY